MSTLHIQNGTLVHSDHQEQADIFIRDMRIEAIGNVLEVPEDAIKLDARGKLIFPGVIDPHTHMGIPIKSGFSADNFASGSRSALHGGVTSILDFTILEPHQSLQDSLDTRVGLAGESLCDVGLHINISRFDEKLLAEIPGLVKAGFNSFKTFTTYREAGMMLSYEQIEQVAGVIAHAGGLLMVHSEDDDLISQASKTYLGQGLTHPRYHGLSRPPQAEKRAIQKLGEISERTGCSIYIVHLNTAEGLALTTQYPRLYVETCPHYLLLDDTAYGRSDGAMYVASPPLRSQADQSALWEGLENGQVHTIGSDHCPFCLADKPAGLPFEDIPNGMGGVETLFPTLLAQFIDRGLDLSLLAGLTSRNPARIFGLNYRKGALKPGRDADMLIVDPLGKQGSWEQQLETRLDWNAYSGLPALFPETVIRRGEQVVTQGKITSSGPGMLLRADSAGQK